MSFTFLSPNWLWALIILVPLGVMFWWWGRERRRAAAAFADPALLQAGAGRGARRLRAGAAVLILLAIAMGPIAMAQPALDRTEDQKRGVVMLAIDTSLSMRKTDLTPSRLDAAKEAARRFLKAAPEETAIGLITFDDGARVRVAPTTDREAVRSALAGLEVREGTALGDAVVTGIAALRGAGALNPPLPETAKDSRGRILVLTDGAGNVGVDASVAAERAKAVRVPVYTTLLGDDPGRADRATPREQLATLATQTGGVFTQSSSTDDLLQVFDDLGGALVPVRKLTELSVWAGLLALLLVGGAGLLSERARTKPLPAPAPRTWPAA